MKFVILAVLLGLFIAFVVALVKSAKNTRWYQITSAVFVMLFAILFLFPTAGVLKSRQAWTKVAEDQEKQLKLVQEEHLRLEKGDPADDSAPEGLNSLSLKLSKIGTEVGRRWGNLNMANSDASGQVTLRVPPAPVVPGQDPAAAANSRQPLVPVGLVVYGFGEGKFPELEQRVPTKFLGEFRVSASQPNAVTMAPTSKLEPNQLAAISSGQTQFWSLYEMLPVDGHDPFIAEGSKPNENNILGRVDDKLVNMVLKSASPDSLANYLRDGERGAPETPDAHWVKIRFDEKYTPDEVDSPEQRGALEGGFFDQSGRAVDIRLQRPDGQGITFAAGDELILKEEEATKLTTGPNKVATKVDDYYLRPLNDYRFILRRLRLQIQELNTRITQMEFEKKVLDTAEGETVGMLEKGQTEKKKLEEDLAQYQIENTALKSYFGQVREELRQMKEASSALYRSNFELLQRIERLASAPALSET